MSDQKNNSSQSTYFTEEYKHRLVDKFCVAYYNETVKPSLAEKSKGQERSDLYTFMRTADFNKLKDNEIVACQGISID